LLVFAVVLGGCGGADEVVPDRTIDAAAIDAPPADAGIDGFVPFDAPDDDSGITYLPDLVLVPEEMTDPPLIDTTSFNPADAAVVEGCVGAAGTRRLLRFDTVTGNVGNLDLWMGVPSADNPAFEWSPAHGHYHVTGYAEYRLVDGSGTVVTGHKQAFCLMDSIPIVEGVPGKYHCGNQGITAGWADVYARYLDCQWIDISGVPTGTYTLEIEVNPDGVIEELDVTNNLWTTEVQI
jgi:hypothetical protein